MSDNPPRREPSVPEVDVSRPRSWLYLKYQQWRQWDLLPAWTNYVVYPFVGLFLAYRLYAGKWSEPSFLAVLGCLLLAASAHAWSYLRFSWWHLAERPSILAGRGNDKGAARAFEKSIKRANRFARDDVRRAAMPSFLSIYLDDQARLDEAKAMYGECIEINAKHSRVQPTDYLTALNNYAMFLLNTKDFAQAQEIMELVVDFMLATKQQAAAPASYYRREEMELIFNQNLAYLFVIMDHLTEAETYLRYCEGILEILPKGRKVYYRDYLCSLRAMWECKRGNHADAWRRCGDVSDQDHFMCVQVRAKIQIAKQAFAEAEKLLCKLPEIAKGRRAHHPAWLEHSLDLAEALFGQGKHDDAFAKAQKARGIVADFALPSDGAWKKTLETWLQRAKDLGRSDIAASLESEFERIPVNVNQAFMVSEKLRIAPKTA